jgi:hypothetical protein
MGINSILNRLTALAIGDDKEKSGHRAYLAQLLGGRRVRPTKDDGEKAGEEKRENRAMRGTLYHPRPIPSTCPVCWVTSNGGLCADGFRNSSMVMSS